MEPVDPKNRNGEYVEIAASQPEYKTLPARMNDGVVYTRWKFSFRERLCVLFGAKLDLNILTFGENLQPILPTIE